MKLKLTPLVCLSLLACTHSHRLSRHVPPAEAAWYKITIDQEPPEQGRKTIPARIAAAIQVAMDDFLPWDAPLPADAEADDVCRSQRQSWDIQFRNSPADDKVVLVAIMLAPGACHRGPVPLDLGVTYAVDTNTESILAIQTAIGRVIGKKLQEEAASIHFPGQLDQQEYKRIEGNMAAAIQLALDDFRPQGTVPPPQTGPEDACLYQRRSYDVTAAPAPDAIMLVRFDVNDNACPSSTPTVMDGVTHPLLVEAPIYAIDLRTTRILTFASYPRRRQVKQ